MRFLRFLIFYFIIVNCSNNSFAQNKKVIQVTGVVMSLKDNKTSIPFASVYVKNRNDGDIANYDGVYSVVCYSGDTLLYSSIGFKDKIFVVPTVEDYYLKKIIYLENDITQLPEVIVKPYPTPEEFPYAFINEKIPDDMLEIARKNLEQAYLREIESSVRTDAYGSAAAAFRADSYKSYFRNQSMPQNIFNPFAWAQFFKALKRGDFKKKKKN
jgi:hypothetical protein